MNSHIKPTHTPPTHTLIQGNNTEVLCQYPDCHFDAIVTDPPYGIEFLGKAWDHHTGAVATWRECLRVLKPGGHLLAFSAARTYHNLAHNIESVGFEIRDQLMWIYSSGFPKAQDIGKALDKRAGKMDPNYGSKKTLSQGNEIVGDFATGARCGQCNRTFNADIIKDCAEDPCGMRYQHQTPLGQQWSGWKTALKPGHEPIVMARKPFKGSTTDNVLSHGVGALNIDATRIKSEPFAYCADGLQKTTHSQSKPSKWTDSNKTMIVNNTARYPSNVLGLIPDYQKYFYCPKVSRRERHVGFEQSHIPTNSDGMMSRDAQGQLVNNYTAKKPSVGNNHPTVKPVALMRYLIQLVTPAHSKVLDPFMGSGSTGMAAVALGHHFVGIDLDARYVEIADKRIQGWIKRDTHPKGNLNHIPTDPSGMNDKDVNGPPGENYASRKQRISTQETTTSIKNKHLFDDLFE